MIHIALSLLIPIVHAEFTPLPASTPESTNSNFKTIDEEIRRLDAVISSTYGALGVLNGTNTWTGTNSFSQQTYVSEITATGSPLFAGSTNSLSGYTVIGTTNATLAQGLGTVAIYAKSVDNTTLSSGCVVVLGSLSTTAAEASSADPSTLVFASTTTNVSPGAIGVLQNDTCDPGSVCLIGMFGIARVLAAGTIAFGDSVNTSTTRCRATAVSSTISSYSFGQALSGAASGEWFWVFLGGH